MIISSMALSTLMTKNMNPIFIAIYILFISIISSMIVFKSSITSWIAFVMILTFSSGMMTLFMYTASLSANETMKTSKKNKWIIMVILTIILMPSNNMYQKSKSMTTFSNSLLMIIMGSILIITMIALSIHGHHPNQTISSSF